MLQHANAKHEAYRIEDGVYRGIREEVYHTHESWAGRISASMLWPGNTSMRHLKAAMGRQIDTDSEDKKFGRDFHCRLLTPDLFKNEYKVMPDYVAELFDVQEDGTYKSKSDGKSYSKPKAGTEYKQAVAAWEAENANSPQLPIEHLDRIEAMADAVYEHDAVGLLRAKGGHEVSIATTIEGLPAKCRTDKLTDGKFKGKRVIIDLKKCQCADEYDCRRAIRDYGYYFRAAFYIDIVRAATGDDAHFIWVFIEDKPPYDVNVIAASDEDYTIGRFEYRNVIERYKQCLESGRWPGRSNQINWGGLPDWYVKQARSAGIL